jgi:hypothetical protein
MSDTDATDPTTAGSMANAAQNAGYPATAGDVDRSTGLPVEGHSVASTDPTADASAADVVAWLDADGLDTDERERRAGHAEQLVDGHRGDDRKSVKSAIRRARA